MVKKWIFASVFFCSLLHNANALEDEKAFAKASLNALKVNHFAKHIAMPFENDTNFGYGTFNKTQNILNFKPVVPFRVTPSYDLIIRTIAPIFETTPISKNTTINGWGDINPTFFISPSHFDLISWGLGPTVSMPTSTNSRYIGSGKWSVGPELAFYVLPGDWVIGFLTDNMWSVAGDSQRPAVNQFSFEYLISYTFDKGWYIASNPSITANWKKPGNQQWVVPVGLGGGRAFKWYKQAITVGVEGNYNVVSPSGVGPNWQLQLKLEWLFPPAF